jgi:hypothetical protein
MSNLGVFRDDFYNAIHVLPAVQAAATEITATGTIPAVNLAGALECVTQLGGTSQTYTTDTAANIIAQLQTAVATAQKANVGGFVASVSAPPLGVPNFFNVSWVVTFNLSNVTTAATLAGGSGVTLAAIGNLSSTALAAATGSAGLQARYAVTVTSANSVTFTRIQ